MHPKINSRLIEIIHNCEMNYYLNILNKNVFYKYFYYEIGNVNKKVKNK